MAAHANFRAHRRSTSFDKGRRIVLLATPLLALPLITSPALPHSPELRSMAQTMSLEEPTNTPSTETALELDEPATVTLLTGDKITLYPSGAVDAETGPGRDHIVFEESRADGQIRVVPSDAARLLEDGKLDERLFDVSYLVREGYDDASLSDMPLIIEGRDDEVDELVDGRGTMVEHHSAKLQMSVVAQEKRKDKGRLWSRMTAADGSPVSLVAGVKKVWLDGMAHVQLDESVPQIGAPQVWESGITGAGVTVAVLDTGVDSTHSDLVQRVVAEKSFVDSPTGGALLSDQVVHPIAYRIVFGAAPVPEEGSSDPLADVGRACVESEGDELEADPAGMTALIVRGDCDFAEKYDAAVDAGATGVVFYNNELGLDPISIGGATHAGAVWAAYISADHGRALRDAVADREVTLTFPDQYAGDLHGHGRHVASTIAGSGAASDGLRRGVAPNANLINGKVCDATGSCRDSWIIAGMEWAAENGADIVNMSLGGIPTDGTDPLSQAVNTLAEEHDVLFVIAAGNSGRDGYGSVESPGTADAALTVGAVDKNDELTWFSSLGPRRGDFVVKPELTAPGDGIVAARAGGTAMGAPTDIDYTAASGTSMATPHAAGAAALLAQARPSLSAVDLKDALVSTTAPGEHLWFEQGTGRVDLFRAITQDVYADAAIGFGSLSSDDSAVEREITYTNHGHRLVTLRLSASVTDLDGNPVDAVTLPKGRVVLRPGHDQTVTVTIDPQSIDTRPGPHGGVIVAEADGIRVRTALGFDIQRTVIPLADDWSEGWSESYNDFFAGSMYLKGSALSPDGTQLVLVGTEYGPNPRIIAVAVDSATGEELWTSEIPKSGVSSDLVSSGVEFSPDGRRVYLSEDTWNQELGQRDIATIALNNVPSQHEDDPGLGQVLWESHYDTGYSKLFSGVGGQRLAVSADGSTVLVVGSVTEDVRDESQAVTIAYDAETGSEKWTTTHGKDGLHDRWHDIATSPVDDVAFVSGFEQVEADAVSVQPVTVAYAIDGDSAGEQLWITRSNTTTGNYASWHNAISDNGKRVFVSATAQVDDAAPGTERMSTHAYDTGSGQQLWESEFDAADHGFVPGHTETPKSVKGSAVAVSPDDEFVYVTGRHCERTSCTGAYAIVTVAYHQQSGEEAWFQIHEGIGRPGRDITAHPAGLAVAASPDGSQVYVAGGCCWSTTDQDDGKQVTLAYAAATGDLLATARHTYVDDHPHINQGLNVHVRPDGQAIYTIADISSRDNPAWGISAYRPPIVASAQTNKMRGKWLVSLTWSALGVDEMEINRGGETIAIVDDADTYVDEVGRRRPGTELTYTICAAGTRHCSREMIVVLGKRPSRPDPH